MEKIETIYKTFTDRNNRNITVGCTDTDIIAEHNNTEVGRFGVRADEVEEGHPDSYILYHAEINPAFRNSGISTVMFEACEEWFTTFDISDHFTEEGANYINLMLKNVAQHSHEVKKDPRF